MQSIIIKEFFLVTLGIIINYIPDDQKYLKRLQLSSKLKENRNKVYISILCDDVLCVI